MPPARALASAGCSSCRAALLRLFTTDLVVPATLPVRSSARLAPVRQSVLSTSAFRFYTTPARQPESTVDTTAPAVSPQDDAENADSVPWYLQEEPPRHIATLEPPPLPPVPADSPPILSAILEYASEELGLDEIALLDLRELDPPPALGSNLFMLFGTARSERHLNVSAGRFVRWLRAKHRVQANADGLLGPNERKTKLRRKARKAKLLQIMGTDETDDGMRTGWICVNLGTVGRSGPEEANIGEDGRLTGFGTAREGTSIVFQIMTEARRAEMDLEELWSSSLEKSRALSKTRALSAPGAETQEGRAADALQTPTRPTLSEGQVRKPLPQHAVSFSTARTNNSTTPSLRTYSTSIPAVEETAQAEREVEEQSRILRLLHNFLSNGPANEVMKATGGRPSDKAQETEFTTLFDRATAVLDNIQSWPCRLTFHAKCVAAQPSLPEHAAVSQKLLKEMELCGIMATREQYLELLGAICRARHLGAEPSSADLALSLLQTMRQRGQDVLASDVLMTMLEHAISQPGATAESPLVKNLWDLVAQSELPCWDEKSLTRLLRAAVRKSDSQYSMFWNVWQMPARHLQARSPTLYFELLRLATIIGDPLLCAQVIRRCVLDMPHERPPVVLDSNIETALRACINVADPTAEKFAARLPTGAATDPKLTNGREFVILLLQINAAARNAALGGRM